MESAWPDAEGRNILVEPVGLALKACMFYAPVHSVSQIDLALDRAAPRWRVRILKISHVDIGSRVEGVNHHFPIHWTRNLYSAKGQIRWWGSDLPRNSAHIFCFRKQPREYASSDLLTDSEPSLKEFAASLFEDGDKCADEIHRVLGEYCLKAQVERAENVELVKLGRDMLRVQLRQEGPVLGSILLELVSSDPPGPRPRPSVETEPPRSNPSSRLSQILPRRSLGRPGRSILFPRSSGV